MSYESYFDLDELPFSISPDPRYLYLTTGHREALAHLLYGVAGSGGFVLLTGEIGAGKTTVCRCLLEQLPEDVDVALVLNPKLDVLEFLQSICDELKIVLPGGNPVNLKLLVDSIYQYLLAAHARGRNTVLIVDEAQHLGLEVVEQLRLLTNLETNKKKLLQIILIGQPELRDLLDSPALRQLAQRITARFHLNLLSLQETRGYIRHRLKVAGSEQELFSRKSVKFIWKKSAGVPRLINGICDRALLGAGLDCKKKVSMSIAIKAANEVLGDRNQPAKRAAKWRLQFIFGTLLLVAVIIAGIYSHQSFDRFPGSDWSAIFDDVAHQNHRQSVWNPVTETSPPEMAENPESIKAIDNRSDETDLNSNSTVLPK